MRLRLFLLPILLAALASAQTAGFTEAPWVSIFSVSDSSKCPATCMPPTRPEVLSEVQNLFPCIIEDASAVTVFSYERDATVTV